MGERDKVLLLRALDNIVHGDESLLDLVHHSFLTLKRHFLVRFDLLQDGTEFAVYVLSKVILIPDSVLCFRLQLFLKAGNHMPEPIIVGLHFFKFKFFDPLPVLFRRVEHSKILVSIFFNLLHKIAFDPLDNGLNALGLL